MSDDLFLTREDDYATSIQAAAKVEERLSALMRSVYATLARFPGGLTDSELRAKMIMAGHPDGPESTYRKRRTDLATLEYVIRTGERRQNERGSFETVWAISPTKMMLT